MPDRPNLHAIAPATNSFPSWRISIRVGLVAGVVALVASTAALIHLPWSYTARTGVTALALRLNDQAIENARAKMSELLDDALTVEKTLAQAVAAGALDIDSAKTRDGIFLSLLRNHPPLASIEYGLTDDRSFLVRRFGDGILAEETRTADGVERKHTVHYPESPERHGVPLAVEDARTDYKVSGQFWFKQAFATKGASWSDIYRRPEDGRQSFSTVEAVTAPSGHPGVIAVSLGLDGISAFLETIETGSRGAVFLSNSYAELVAAADASSPGSMRMSDAPSGKKLAEAGAPLIRIAAKALQAGGIRLSELHGRRQVSYRDRATGETYFVTVSPLSQMGLIVGLIVPAREILGGIDRNAARLGMILLAFMVVIAALVAVLASITLGRPLAAVTRNALLLGDFRFDDIKPVASRLSEIASLSQATLRMNASLASFRKYVPTEVVRTLFAQGMEAELGGTRRDLTVFFMDMANFTRIAEELGESLIPFLAEFLGEMSGEIRDGGGTIDKYIGDAIMAFWGAPAANPNHAVDACRAALACQTRLESLRARVGASHGIEMRARIGINTGRVLVGNVGSQDRLNYTAIGDPVNVASRLEALNKRYGSGILIGEETYLATQGKFVARRLERVAVYGKSEGIEIYELLARMEDATPELLAFVAAYERGIDAFRRRAWSEAESLFLRVLAMRGGTDRPSQLMLDRARVYRDAPPPPEWDGLLRLSEK